MESVSETRRRGNGHTEPDRASSALKTITMDVLLGGPVPKREWLVDPWMPANNVTLFAGDGGTGKTTVAMQLGWAGVSGRRWLGMAVRPCSVLYMSCEEETAEIHYRGQQLYEHEVAATGLDRFHFLDLAGSDDTLLVMFKGDKPEVTRLFQIVEGLVTQYEAGLLIIDSVADVFGGDENS